MKTATSQPPQRSTAQADHLLSPEIARTAPPRTPASVRGRTRDTSSEYYTAAWGSPYEVSPSSRSAHTALSERALSEEPLTSSPGPEFGLDHLVPSRLGEFTFVQAGASPLARLTATARAEYEKRVSAGSTENEDTDLTPRSRAKRWVQLPRSQDPSASERAHWWSDESRGSSPDRGPKRRRRRQSSGSIKAPKPRPSLGHRSRDSNRTLDQQTFWERLRKRQSGDMSLSESRWAATPPPEPKEQKPVVSPIEQQPTTGMDASQWASSPLAPNSDKNGADSGLAGSRWADPPSPLEKAEPVSFAVPKVTRRWADTPSSEEKSDQEREGVERMEANTKDAYVVDAPDPQVEVDEAIREGTAVVPEDDGNDAEAVTGDENVAPAEEQTNDDQVSVDKTPNVTLDESKEIFGTIATPNMPPLSPTKLRAEPPRLRKKVSWKGKNCFIQIPNFDYASLGVFPLSLSEVSDRVKRFEDDGYDVKAFNLASEIVSNDDAVQVRPIYPDETETKAITTREGPNVRLPDLQKWRDYTNWLLEQKLAALGVGFSSDEPTSAGAQDMSRTSSNQFGSLPPFSPPIPSHSASSAGRPGMLRGHSHTMSVAAPAMSPVNSPFGHMHRHSTFTGQIAFPGQQQVQQPLIPGLRTMSPLGQQPSIPGVSPFAPNQFAIPGFNRTGSPAQVLNLRNDLGAARSPGSPLSHQVLPYAPQDLTRGFQNNNVQNQSGYFPAFQQQQKPSPLSPFNANPQFPQALPQLPEEDDEEELQEEPEAAPEPPPETPTYVPPYKRAQINENIAVPTPRGHRHNISEGLERDILETEKRRVTDRQSWIEVEESGEEPQSTDDSTRSAVSMPKASAPAPVAERDPLSEDLVVQERETTAHSRKKSTAARFNVTAPAFKFNPSASFQPASTAFNFGSPAPNANAQPVTTAFNFSGSSTNGHPASGHNRQQSSGNFNVAAPVFKPGGSSNFSSVPQGEFSFSSNGPVFKPGAPSFEAPKQHDHKNSIFGKVEIPDIVKPARRSKAVEIKRPDEDTAKSGSGTDFEDEEGRIAQSEDRLKRQRKFDDDGDEVPQFALPGPMPAPAGMVLKSQPEDEVEDIEEQEAPMAKLMRPEDVLTPPDSSKSVEPERQAPLRMHKPSSSLSAIAKPFVPSDTECAPGHQARESYASISELEEGELRDDGHPPTSPLKGSEPSPLLEQNDRGLTPIMREAPLVFDEQPSARVNDFNLAEPSYDEIDAVMRQLNEMDDDHEIKQAPDISPLSTPSAHPMDGVTYLPEWSRSDAPSPSPRRQHVPFNPENDSSFTIHERPESGEREIDGWPQPHRLNKADDAPLSDWSRDFSVHDEEKLQQRGQFFDNRIEDLIGRAVEKRLQPLEESLRNIHSSVNKRPTSRDLQPQRSSSAIESDADDEDEMSDQQRHRPISRCKEKRADQIKTAVLEALREQNPSQLSETAQDIQELHQVLHDMKMSFARAASNSLELDDVRAVVEDIVGKQSQALVPIAMDDASNKEVEHRREMSGLDRRLNETLASALEEANLRRSVEEREAESRRMLRLAEEELQLLRDSGRDGDSRLNAAEEEREDLFARLEKAEDTKRDLEEQVRNLEAESEATHATLEEYRMSSHKWRQDIDTATQDREELENTITGLERELEESQELGSSMRRRLEKLHSDMATAAGQLASDKASMKAKEDEYKTRCEHLEAQQETNRIERARLEEEVRTLRASATEASEAQQANHFQERSVLENELHALRAGASEASEAQTAKQLHDRSLLEEELTALRASAVEAAESRVALDQMRISNSSFEEVVRKLQVELVEHQSQAVRFERDFNDARESGRAEVERTRMSLETDIEAANHQVNVVRVQYESELAKAQAELENVKIEAETAKARHERHLEEEDDARRENLRKVNHASSVALDEARQIHEATIIELRSAHDRALGHALEDKQRSEYFLNEKLTLSDSKLQHFQDRVLHLEERLEVAKSAAQAAVMSAQSKAAPISRSAPVATATAALPEKISPQALRESILVLQEQLQEREAKIEKLQSEADQDGPAELKKRDDEVAWLREVLAVRGEELTDLINTLAKPTYDRAHVRDTAIRIRANLQMEQQEKERFNQNPNPLSAGQAIASLSNFATPKAVQLSSAFQKWRSNMESSALRSAPRAPTARPRSNTPSKPSSSSGMPQEYMSGLMTPPASNLRSTPSPEASASLPPPRLESRASKENVVPSTEPPKPRSRVPSAASDAPTTPLFRSQSYDRDAEDNEVSMRSFEDEDLDIADNAPPAFRSLEDELDTAVEDDEL